MILATLSTRNFDFAALAATEPEAERLMTEAWERHCAEYEGAEPRFMADAILDGEVNFVHIEPGTALRDGEPIVTPNSF